MYCGQAFGHITTFCSNPYLNIIIVSRSKSNIFQYPLGRVVQLEFAVCTHPRRHRNKNPQCTIVSTSFVVGVVVQRINSFMMFILMAYVLCLLQVSDDNHRLTHNRYVTFAPLTLSFQHLYCTHVSNWLGSRGLSIHPI